MSVSGAAAADLDSGGGPVTASAIQGLLTVTAGRRRHHRLRRGQREPGLRRRPRLGQRRPGPLNVTAEGGSIDAHGTGSATLDSGGGPVNASAVLGTLTVTAEGGSINVTGAQGANLNAGGGPVFARTIDGPLSVTTDGGSLQVSTGSPARSPPTRATGRSARAVSVPRPPR